CARLRGCLSVLPLRGPGRVLRARAGPRRGGTLRVLALPRSDAGHLWLRGLGSLGRRICKRRQFVGPAPPDAISAWRAQSVAGLVADRRGGLGFGRAAACP